MELDVVVVGAGIAGASLAAHLSGKCRVLVLEAEKHAGYHSTGRSAALFSEIYGNACIRALTRASRPFLFQPPTGFAEAPLVRPRQTLYFARRDQLGLLSAFRGDRDIGARTVELSEGEARLRLPIFRSDWLGGAALDVGSADIDVDVLHQGFLRQARSKGASIRMSSEVTRLNRVGSHWQIDMGQTRISAPIVVNAAGAWGDQLAQLAGVRPLGLQPMRRTAVLIDAPKGFAVESWPAAVAVDESFYFKPDAGALLLSPADEQPSPACDAQPEEIDVATAVDRFEQATDQRVSRVRHRWAGLRVFSPDRTPIVGFDPSARGFFWLVGQGGYGIQTCEALASLAAALIMREAIPEHLLQQQVDPEDLSPSRFEGA